ncbi:MULTISPECIES: hypothetical protein [unclassified Sphingomonas]|uniref:hypothetical protein n=1 Tax=unclassified Sphingomonas TaxID=196159 RepID=UPI0028649B08|nr:MULTISPECIES: hypothetical protein [unclassified Sphingomonas]MDR6115803.1 hypothetical protein [Sphingomonas sp. SORGH_AS_0789]MDR6150526.1 hypothetical protein [Sphingomonas sp. SORGH_AS_0742]
MDELYAAFKHLARRFHGRWSRLDDALTLIRSTSGARPSEGERTRRMLLNAFRVQTYPSEIREALQTDRLNAMRALGDPLSKALGHIITIEFAEEMLRALDDAEGQRKRETAAAKKIEKTDQVYGPFIRAMHNHGIVRGDHEVMTEQDWAVVAKYIRRRVAARLRDVPPVRTYQETLTPDGRLHPFWNGYRMPVDQVDGEEKVKGKPAPPPR